MRRQLIVSNSNLPLVAMLAVAGYPYRYVPQEGNYLFDDVGDIEEMRDDFEAGRQSISDCKKLMLVFAELLKQGQSESVTTTLRPEKIEMEQGREWTTHTIADATILYWAGYPLLRTCVEATGRVAFTFGHDANLNSLIKRSNNRQLLVEPHAFTLASRAMWDELKKAHNKSREAKEGREDSNGQ